MGLDGCTVHCPTQVSSPARIASALQPGSGGTAPASKSRWVQCHLDYKVWSVEHHNGNHQWSTRLRWHCTHLGVKMDGALQQALAVGSVGHGLPMLRAWEGGCRALVSLRVVGGNVCRVGSRMAVLCTGVCGGGAQGGGGPASCWGNVGRKGTGLPVLHQKGKGSVQALQLGVGSIASTQCSHQGACTLIPQVRAPKGSH